MPVKNIALLGSTGSIGVNTLDVVAANPEQFAVVAISAGRNVALLIEQAKQFKPEAVAIWDESQFSTLKTALAGQKIKVLCGDEGVEEIAGWPPAQQTVSAIVGAAGLKPTLAAIKAGKEIALANKECLVMAGELFMDEVAKAGVTLLPVDSEHSAIFQALFNGQTQTIQPTVTAEYLKEISHITLTASGGPFVGWTKDRLQHVSQTQALAHPNWSMGRKISIDSATMMNKGLEVIEAYYLFGIPAEQIKVIIHPESIVHSMVSFYDGSVVAQLGAPDMRTPIAVALSWPKRIATAVATLDLVKIGTLNFFPAPKEADFPCLHLAFKALATGKSAPATLNAANEIAVAAFLENKIEFMDIPRLIEWTMENTPLLKPASIADIMDIDRDARAIAAAWVLQNTKKGNLS
ncbi:MAG: 1-deoxy-D-xylulose-5-phosphate reductoisomerase [Magnetococcales bacterium]|nr:1-deoxy-D-xylulose-5-phosphate reductoisomerase [Magnetococcales bacterium]